ncbi:MAG: DNA polymerase IV [Anaerolineales bacterium]|nr:DNA polymerase IV [Anaerolineales bacterium]
MDTPRVILHLDLDAFFCAVEEIKDPGLRGKAFAVGGSPSGRGVVTSCSYPARKMGVRSAMPAAKALQLCPDLILVSRNHRDYGRYSKLVMEHLANYTDQVEQISIDEAFLDITDLESAPRAIGIELQKTILRELSLPNSVGIASNKLVAKIATDVGKIAHKGEGPPNAITIVPAGEERSFLAPFPVDMLWGVGPKTRERLERFNIRTIGDLADYPDIELANKFGKHGYDLSRRAKGIDKSGIVTQRGIKSVSNERTFGEDLGRKSEVLKHINKLSDQVSKRLIKKDLRGKTIQIKLRWADFTTLTRQITLPQTTNEYRVIQKTSEELLNQVWQEGRRVRLIGVGVHNLDTDAHQLGLWDTDYQRNIKLQETLKDIKSKYGDNVISRGIKK